MINAEGRETGRKNSRSVGKVVCIKRQPPIGPNLNEKKAS